jgi:phage protein D
VSQQNQHDIDFLYGRARECGYVLVSQEPDPEVPGSKKRLYFGPPRDNVPGLRPVTYRLEWGKSLLEFNPTMTTANQVESVTVMGMDRSTHKRIKETVKLSDSRFNTNRDLFRLLKADGRQEVVVNEPVRTPKEARERAFAILLDRLRKIVTVSASTIGLPDLRAGQLVEIAGVGSRLSGTYFITATTHKLDDQGYTTKFEARREQIGGAS